MWNVIVSFLQGRVSTLFRWGVYVFYIVYREQRVASVRQNHVEHACQVRHLWRVHDRVSLHSGNLPHHAQVSLTCVITLSVSIAENAKPSKVPPFMGKSGPQNPPKAGIFKPKTVGRKLISQWFRNDGSDLREICQANMDRQTLRARRWSRISV